VKSCHPSDDHPKGRLPPSDDHWNVPGWFAGFFAVLQAVFSPVGEFLLVTFSLQQLFRRWVAFLPVDSFFAGRQLFHRSAAVLWMIVRMLPDVLSAGDLFSGRRLFCRSAANLNHDLKFGS
jgi:hypothetical protein